jgi:hypothetical protein
MSNDKDHLDSKTRHRELEHERRKDLHEDSHLHPHHHNADHVRHHHRTHILKHHGKETAEEKKFIDRENHQHRLEMNREVWEDEGGRRMLKRTEKVSGTPSSAKKGANVKSSSSNTVQERLNNIRLRVAYARSVARERGEKSLGL